MVFKWSKWSAVKVREERIREKTEMLLRSWTFRVVCAWRGSPLKFTCNIGDGGLLAARHVVVVEVDHDDSLLLFLQRQTVTDVSDPTQRRE